MKAMPKPYDPSAANPPRMVDLIRRLGRRDSAPQPIVDAPGTEPEELDDPGSGPIPAPTRPR